MIIKTKKEMLDLLENEQCFVSYDIMKISKEEISIEIIIRPNSYESFSDRTLGVFNEEKDTKGGNH